MQCSHCLGEFGWLSLANLCMECERKQIELFQARGPVPDAWADYTTGEMGYGAHHGLLRAIRRGERPIHRPLTSPLLPLS